MHTAIATAALAGLLAAVPLAEASAWTRQGTVTTAHGTYAVDGAGGCVGRSCAFSRTVTGPNGGTVTRSGRVTKVGPRHYRYVGRVTGPYGGTVVRRGSVFVAP